MKKLFGLMVMAVLLMQSAFAANLTVIIDGIYMTSTREVGKEVTITSKMDEIVGWEVKSGGVTLENNKFVMPDNDVVIEAITNRKYLLTVSNLFVETMEEKTERQAVEIQATSNENYEFLYWEATGIELTDEQKSASSLTFTMPSNPVTIEAIYEIITLDWDTTGQLTKTLKLKSTDTTVIDWGDGVVETYAASPTEEQNVTHTYAAEQNYEVKLGGDNNITYFDCTSSQISALDVSNNLGLITLRAWTNNISSVDVSNNTKLEELQVGENALTALDVTNNTELIFLTLDDNNISSIDLSKNTKLQTVYLHENSGLTTLDVTNNTELTYLAVRNCSISSLDISNCINLETLSANYNNLTELNVSNNTKLMTLKCGYNEINSLGLNNNTALTYLDCTGNNLDVIDLSNCRNLETVSVNANNLTELNLSNNPNISVLYCGANNLEELDVSNITLLNKFCCTQASLPSVKLNETQSNMTVINELEDECTTITTDNTMHKHSNTTIEIVE